MTIKISKTHQTHLIGCGPLHLVTVIISRVCYKCTYLLTYLLTCVLCCRPWLCHVALLLKWVPMVGNSWFTNVRSCVPAWRQPASWWRATSEIITRPAGSLITGNWRYSPSLYTWLLIIFCFNVIVSRNDVVQLFLSSSQLQSVTITLCDFR